MTLIKQSVQHFKNIPSVQGFMTILRNRYHSVVHVWRPSTTWNQKTRFSITFFPTVYTTQLGRESTLQRLHFYRAVWLTKTTCLRALRNSWREVHKGACLALQGSSIICPDEWHSSISRVQVALQLRKDVQLCGSWMLAARKLGLMHRGHSVLEGFANTCNFLNMFFEKLSTPPSCRVEKLSE